MEKGKNSILAQNKKAFAEYEILEKFEAGIVLSGAEVKSVRASHANLKGSFVEVTAHHKNTKNINKNAPSAITLEALVRNVHISPYKQAPQLGYSPTQKRKLLLHHKEILKLKNHLDTKGTTIVPLDFHLSHNHIKMQLGICQSKKKHDRRNELKKKAQNLEISRALKKY
ncbi:MAG: SsrA-binding protein SmpB [Candidatus Gracilibacteria bacterium]|jgi:SsrA-binding protein